MTDIEKAIEGFKKAGEEAKTVIEKWVSIFEQYINPVGIDDVISLLKEQEAVKPTVSGAEEHDGHGGEVGTTEREKVMTWLEICGKNDDCSGCCPYGDEGETFNCRTKLIADAFDLLKEQEPRVLTREEMKNMIGESVFVEEPPNNADPRCGWAEVTEGIEPPEEGFNFPGGVDFNAESAWDTYDGDLYGLDKGCGWRAWNRRPTPEQMKAVTWE